MPQSARVTVIDEYMKDLLAPPPPSAPAKVQEPVATAVPVSVKKEPEPAARPVVTDTGTGTDTSARKPEPLRDAPAPERRRASDRRERWIGFTVAGQAFGVEVLQVIEVQIMCEVTPVPGASPELLGAINLRGQIVSVLDLSQRLGFGVTPPTPATRIIVVDYRGHPVGLRVDSVSEVITANVSSVESPPVLGGRISAGWIRGVLRNKGETVLLLDPVKLLADVER